LGWACLTANIFAGLQDRAKAIGVIAIERKLRRLAWFESCCAFENELVDNLSEFRREGHEIDEAFKKLSVTAEEGKEDDQQYIRASQRACDLRKV
jgi:hypothetical protein